MNALRLLIALLGFWFLSPGALAHDGLDLEPPTSASEAWNVIRLCHANIQSLAAEERWKEIGLQASLSIQAWRFLREHLNADPAQEPRRRQLQELEQQGLSLFNATQAKKREESLALIARYTEAMREQEKADPPAIVRAEVYSCPMCRGVKSLDAKATCPKCGMQLEPRIIPASDVYTTPGEPSIALTPQLDKPLAAGQSSRVRIRLTRKKDGAPVTLDDLMVVHTEPIHLLIIDESLTDYHHEHPRPTAVPGEVEFTFTPRKPGSYRVFADLVPSVSRVQEYAVCDLPGSAPGEPVSDRAGVVMSTAGDLRFDLRWRKATPPLKEKEPIAAAVDVFSAANGRPFNQLEPVMGAYAHIVGFFEDRKTVVHIHPSGGPEPQHASDRGGPGFTFRFFAPTTGFVRLFVQVQAGGKQVFAPFGVTVVP